MRCCYSDSSAIDVILTWQSSWPNRQQTVRLWPHGCQFCFYPQLHRWTKSCDVDVVGMHFIERIFDQYESYSRPHTILMFVWFPLWITNVNVSNCFMADKVLAGKFKRTIMWWPVCYKSKSRQFIWLFFGGQTIYLWCPLSRCFDITLM